MIDKDGNYYLSVGESKHDCKKCRHYREFKRKWSNGKRFTDGRCLIAFSENDKCEFEVNE